MILAQSTYMEPRRSLYSPSGSNPREGKTIILATRSKSTGSFPSPHRSSPRNKSEESPRSDSGFLENLILEPVSLSNMPSLSAGAGGECPKHPQERLKYYCQQHDELVCPDCLALDPKHQGHTHSKADDLAESYRSSLLSQIQPLYEMSQNAQSALKIMSSRRKEILSNRDTVKEAIKLAVSNCHSQLETREIELLDITEKITQQKLKHHDAHESYLETLATELSHVVDRVNQEASDNSNSVLYHHKPLSEWVLDATRKFQSLPKEVFVPLQAANMNFIPNPNALESCYDIGIVTERQADPLRCYIDEATTKGITLNQECTLHLMVHDSDSRPYFSHIKGIKVDVTSTTTGIPVDVFIEQDSNKKCKYDITFTPSEAGQYVVKVKIGSTPVQNSPLVINVGAIVHGTLIGDIKGVLQPYGITVNDNDEVIVVENGKDCVSIFRSDGKPVRTIQSKAKNKFNRPRGVTITESNHLLITDDDGLKQCTQEGKHLTAIGKPGDGQLEFSFPCGLAVSNHGKIYVCDTFNSRVQILNPDLSFHRYFGNESNPPAKLNQPYDIAFNSSGNFYIADYSDHSIKMFSSQGDFLDLITTKGNQEPLKNPVSVHVNSNDHVFVGEEKAPGLSVYDPAGKYLTAIPVKSSSAYGISTDSQNCVYISDRTNRRIQIYK